MSDLSQNVRIQRLQQKLMPVRTQLLQHPMYEKLTGLDSVKAFMQCHVFAVWDFMSLLKHLQSGLTCVAAPWLPVGRAETRYLINEIVLGEESDVDPQGGRTSHYELYRRAMVEAGASTESIEHLLQQLHSGTDVHTALENAELPMGVQHFCSYTFDVIKNRPLHIAAAVFTFGREDLIPDLFLGLVRQLGKAHPQELGTLVYYLERHIEVDGDSHGHLALDMVSSLCGDDPRKWEEAAEASEEALRRRIGLWDSVVENLPLSAAPKILTFGPPNATA